MLPMVLCSLMPGNRAADKVLVVVMSIVCPGKALEIADRESSDEGMYLINLDPTWIIGLYLPMDG